MQQRLKSVLYFFAPFVLPVTLVYESVVSKRAIWKKVVYILLVLIFITWLFYDAVANTLTYSRLLLLELGLTDKPVEIHTRGPSMLPTFKEEDTVMLSNPKKFGLDRGDIVSFSNQETETLSYLKRIVGLPGERVTVKQGVVWINGKPLKEPYVYEGRPTFGNTFLDECSEVTIPEDSYFVMGDNRGASWDSRAIGFIERESIDGVKKADSATGFYSTPNELAQFEQKELDASQIVQIINTRRTDKKANPVISNSEVSGAAKVRADAIISDFSGFKSGANSVEKSLDAGNYRYNLVHEYVTFGYLTPEEVVNQIFDSPEEENLFLSNQFTEIGVASSNRTTGSCTYPVISIVLSWPSVATYDKDIVDGWAAASVNLSRNINDYQSWVGFPEKDQVKLKELISVSSQMAVIAARIHTRMSNREYLTAEDYSDIKKYNSTLLPRENQLYGDLFGDVQGASTSIDGTRESW